MVLTDFRNETQGQLFSVRTALELRAMVQPDPEQGGSDQCLLNPGKLTPESRFRLSCSSSPHAAKRGRLSCWYRLIQPPWGLSR